MFFAEQSVSNVTSNETFMTPNRIERQSPTTNLHYKGNLIINSFPEFFVKQHKLSDMTQTENGLKRKNVTLDLITT